MALLRRDMYPGLDDNMIQRLRTINVNTVFDFANEDNEKLGRIMKMSYQDVKKFKAQIVETFGGKIRSGTELFIAENNIVSTGIDSLDILLDGGLRPGEIYELCGASSAGKTQLCLSLAVNVVLNTNGIVRYIDTKRDFSAGRVHAILEANGHDNEVAARVMNQIRIIPAKNIHELSSVLYDLTRSLKITEEHAEEPTTRLVIIDSLPAIITAWSKNCESFCHLNNVANASRFIANEFNIPLLTVNLISEWRDTEGFSRSVVDRPVVVKPTLGKFWLRVPNTRLMVKKFDNEERNIIIWKSADLRVGNSCRVSLSETGAN